MIQSTEISSRFWNLLNKANEEIAREKVFIDDIISKAHIERLIFEDLDGIQTVFDGGAGYGRFSIPLAKQGLQVTHFDLSLPMLDRAKQLAAEAGVMDNMRFVHGSLDDLRAFSDAEFDLVLSFDAPISYCYPNHEEVIKNLVRICGKRIVLGVYSRLAWTYLFDPAQKHPYILDDQTNDPLARWTIDHGLSMRAHHTPDMAAVREFFRTGLMEPPERTAAAYERGETPWPISYAFMPGELLDILDCLGVQYVKLAGPGALSRTIPREVLRKIMSDEALKTEFLDFCFWYDSQPECSGLGKDNLIAHGYVG